MTNTRTRVAAIAAATITTAATLTALTPTADAHAATCHAPSYMRYVQGPGSDQELVWATAGRGTVGRADSSSSPSPSFNSDFGDAILYLQFPAGRDVAWSMRQAGTNAIVASGKFYEGDTYKSLPCPPSSDNAKAIVVRMYPDGVI